LEDQQLKQEVLKMSSEIYYCFFGNKDNEDSESEENATENIEMSQKKLSSRTEEEKKENYAQVHVSNSNFLGKNVQEKEQMGAENKSKLLKISIKLFVITNG